VTTRVTAVHQFVPTFEPGAVGGHALQVRRLLRERGLQSEVYAEHLRMPGAVRGRRFTDYRGGGRRRDGHVLLYHMAVGSGVADFVQDRPEPLVVDHHNITPPSFFARWQPELVHGVEWGQDQLARLAGRAALGAADSAYNRAELDAAGYRRTTVAPLLVDLQAFEAAADEALVSRLEEDKAEGGATWLFVGRVTPNKCQHDVVKAFAAYRRIYDPAARLHLVGGCSSRSYWSALEGYVAALGLLDAVRLVGSVPAGVLAAHYRTAEVFVCLSEHEGFCIPVLEAWAHRLPVVGYAAAAVPETVAGGGLLLEDKDPILVAAAVHRVMADGGLRQGLVRAGSARLAEFALERTRARFLRSLEEGLQTGLGA
jgi:glycosyltransferase involved in cell wall biosynthesis